MSQKSYVSCPECGTINLNSDHCVKCGALINIILKRKIIRRNSVAAQLEKQREDPDSKSKIAQLKTHKYWIVRAAANTAYWIWLAVMSVGAAIAYIAGAISA